MPDTPPDLSPERKQAFETAVRPENRALTDRGIVREMLPAIRRKLAAGWSYEAVRSALAKNLGFKATRRTLYNYVWQFSRKVPLRMKDAPPPDGRDQPPPSPEPAAKTARRNVRETLCGLPPDLPAAGVKSPRVSLVQKLNRPV